MSDQALTPDPEVGEILLNGGDVWRKQTGRWRDAIDGYTAEMRAAGLSERTIRQRRYQLGILSEDFLHRSPWRLTRAELADWLGSYQWAASTRMVYRATIRQFYDWARLDGHVKRSPAETLPPIRVPDGVPHPVPDDVVADALARASQRDELVLLLGYDAGLRRAEIAAHRWDQLSGDDLRIRGKGKRVRVIPATRRLLKALRAEQQRRQAGRYGDGWHYRPGDDGGFVFPGKHHGHLAPEVIGRIAHAALGDGWSTHDLRHSYLTRAYQIAGDIRAVAELAGHVKLDTSRGYARLPSDALRRIVDQM